MSDKRFVMLKKIKTENLQLGMHLHAFCGAWLEHPFWRTKFVVTDPKDLILIRQSPIKEVWIDAAKGLDVEAEYVTEAVESILLPELPASSAMIQEKTSFGDELKRAEKICAKGKEAVISMFQEARMGNAIDAEAALSLVEEISDSMLRNPGALISLARLKTADNYTYLHSVAVCALMISLARQLGLSELETREAGMAGLLHDLGKAFISTEILNKPGKLTSAEFAVIKTHPDEGYRVLSEVNGISNLVKDVCLYHHEKIDGTGYPKGLTGDSISLFAKMGAVCDVYDAITSNRPYKTGWDPAESIKRMAEWPGHFDKVVFEAFVKSLGIYPIGSLIRLQSGRVGVVVEQGEKSLLRPKVKVFFSTKLQAHITPKIIDLGRPGSHDKIVGREDQKKLGIKDTDHYWTCLH